jgi:YgiT-type zinc finger domain-containing protein
MSNHKSTYDYGKCHVCGEQMNEKRIKQDFWLKGKLIVIESVPAGVCPQCGEKIVKADVGRQLVTLIRNLKRLPKRKTITVPVVRYAKEVGDSIVARVPRRNSGRKGQTRPLLFDVRPTLLLHEDHPGTSANTRRRKRLMSRLRWA